MSSIMLEKSMDSMDSMDRHEWAWQGLAGFLRVHAVHVVHSALPTCRWASSRDLGCSKPVCLYSRQTLVWIPGTKALKHPSGDLTVDDFMPNRYV